MPAVSAGLAPDSMMLIVCLLCSAGPDSRRRPAAGSACGGGCDCCRTAPAHGVQLQPWPLPAQPGHHTRGGEGGVKGNPAPELCCILHTYSGRPCQVAGFPSCC